MSTKSKMFDKRNKMLALERLRRSHAVSNLVDRELDKIRYRVTRLSIEDREKARKDGVFLTESPVKLHKILIR